MRTVVINKHYFIAGSWGKDAHSQCAAVWLRKANAWEVPGVSIQKQEQTVGLDQWVCGFQHSLK